MNNSFLCRITGICVKSVLVIFVILSFFSFRSTFSFTPSNVEGREKSGDLQIVYPRISTSSGTSSKITGNIGPAEAEQDSRRRITIEVDCPRCPDAGALVLIELDPDKKQSDFIGDGSGGHLKSEWISAGLAPNENKMRNVVKKKNLKELSCDFYVSGKVRVVYYHTFMERNGRLSKEDYSTNNQDDRRTKEDKETIFSSKLALTICDQTYVTGYVHFAGKFEFFIRPLNKTNDISFGKSSKSAAAAAAAAHDLVSYRLHHSDRRLRKRSVPEVHEKNMDEDTTLRDSPFNITQPLVLVIPEPSVTMDQWLFNLTGDTFEIDLPNDLEHKSQEDEEEEEVDVEEIEFRNDVSMFDDRRQQQQKTKNYNISNTDNDNLESQNEKFESADTMKSKSNNTERLLDEKSDDLTHRNLEKLLKFEVFDDHEFKTNSSASPFLFVDTHKNPRWRTREQLLLENDEEEVGYFYDTAWTADLVPISRSNQGDSSEAENGETKEQRWLEIAIAVDHTLIAFHGKDKVESYVLALMNIVNAIYQDTSLNANIKLVVSRLLVYENKKHSVVRPGNAKKSLENVNMWNQRLHASLAPWEPHHDLAIWLTRQDIGNRGFAVSLPMTVSFIGLGGPSGYAPVGGVCDPKRSCALNRDEGLSSAFIIAHEMAHILGLSHDGDKKHSNDCDKDGQKGSVMAPLVTATFSKFAWSECSKKEFKKTITKWSCLSNPPVANSDEIVLNSTLQNAFSMDEQCRMEFGEGYILCRAFDIIEPCSHLWCGHEKSPLVCKTKKGSPLEGTKCGFQKWCVNGYCQNSATALANKKPTTPSNNDDTDNNEDANGDLGGGEGKAPVKLNPRSGGWSKWGPWGACSRSCAIGVQFQTRKCDNPRPLHGGRNCIGMSEKWKTCNKQPCPEPLEDPRAQQCRKMPKLLDLSKTHVANLTWLPYESDDIAKKCKLICISEETKELFESSDNLIDGTPCSYENSDHICVQGVCHFLGCDSKPFSDMKTDSCGVCGGNNSTCSTVKFHSHKKLKRELSRIAVLPKMAAKIELEANVTMHNRSEPAVAFILKNRRKKKYKITIPNTGINTEIMEGTKFYYERRGNRHKIWANGPVLAEMVILVYAPGSEIEAGLNVSLISKYTVNKNEDKQKMEKGNLTARRFEWIKGGWGPCSASCGGGKRQQTVACWDRRDRKLVRRKHCSLTDKPAFKYDKCNEFECNFEWIAGEWEPCTTTCGLGGFQERQLYCVPQAVLNTMLYKTNGSLIDQPWKYMVSPRKCSPEMIPAERRPCNRVPCFSYWTFGEWSQCSTTCGKGVSFRSTHCPPPHSEQFFTCGDAPSENLLQRFCYNTYGRLDRRFYECRKQQNISKRTNGQKSTCEKDRSVYCHLEVLSKYCNIGGFRRLCCKACHDNQDHHKIRSTVSF